MSDPLDGPVFTKRPENDKYQVRFWSTPQDYQQFVDAARAEGLVLQDVLNELMIWFTAAHHARKLQVQEASKP